MPKTLFGLVLIHWVLACSQIAVSTTPSSNYGAVRERATHDTIENQYVRIRQIDLGAVAKGRNIFRAVAENKTGDAVVSVTPAIRSGVRTTFARSKVIAGRRLHSA